MSTATYASYAHEGTSSSLLVPQDWPLEEVAPNHVRFYGPAHAEHDGYRPTLSIQLGTPEGSGDAWFDAFCEQSLARLREDNDGFVLRSVERFTLSSLVEVNATWYEWTHGPGMSFAQLQALIPVDALRMYVVNAATLLPLADTHLPVFDEVLRSLRILPSR